MDNKIEYIKMDGSGMILSDSKLNIPIKEGCWNCFYCDNDRNKIPCDECCYISSNSLMSFKPWHWKEK